MTGLGINMNPTPSRSPEADVMAVNSKKQEPACETTSSEEEEDAQKTVAGAVPEVDSEAATAAATEDSTARLHAMAQVSAVDDLLRRTNGDVTATQEGDAAKEGGSKEKAAAEINKAAKRGAGEALAATSTEKKIQMLAPKESADTTHAAIAPRPSLTPQTQQENRQLQPLAQRPAQQQTATTTPNLAQQQKPTTAASQQPVQQHANITSFRFSVPQQANTASPGLGQQQPNPSTASRATVQQQQAISAYRNPAQQQPIAAPQHPIPQQWTAAYQSLLQQRTNTTSSQYPAQQSTTTAYQQPTPQRTTTAHQTTAQQHTNTAYPQPTQQYTTTAYPMPTLPRTTPAYQNPALYSTANPGSLLEHFLPSTYEPPPGHSNAKFVRVTKETTELAYRLIPLLPTTGPFVICLRTEPGFKPYTDDQRWAIDRVVKQSRPPGQDGFILLPHEYDKVPVDVLRYFEGPRKDF